MSARPDEALERILLALETDLIEATDAEITEVLDGLGFKTMRGSLALADVRHIHVRQRIAALGTPRTDDQETPPDRSGSRVPDDRNPEIER